MPKLVIPNSVALQNVRAFVDRNRPFENDSPEAILEFHPEWVHMEPVALAMAAASDEVALGLAMRPGITGAVRGQYGTVENAGAGLFITRSIAKGSGGYFFLLSGTAAYRLRRAKEDEAMSELFIDPYDEPRHDRYRFNSPWKGTVVSVEIRTEKIGDYKGFFQWIFGKVPRRATKRGRIRFT